MNDYTKLVKVLNNAEKYTLNFSSHIVEKCYEAADAIEQLVKERDELRNELCLRCGEYVEAHNGACDGCRWRAE